MRGESAFLQVDADNREAGIDQVLGNEPTPEFAALAREQEISDAPEKRCEEDDECCQHFAPWRIAHGMTAPYHHEEAPEEPVEGHLRVSPHELR